MNKSSKGHSNSSLLTRIEQNESGDEIRVKWQTKRSPRLAQLQTYWPNQNFQEGHWPKASIPAKNLFPITGVHSKINKKNRVSVVAVALFGLSKDDIKQAIRQIERQKRIHSDFVPLVLTDISDFSLFRFSGCIVEYFPRLQYIDGNENGSFESRFKIIWNKWAPLFLLDLGKPALLRSLLGDYEAFIDPGVGAAKRYDPRRTEEGATKKAIADVSALVAEFEAKGLGRLKDRFCLYRILGNDLPPRHEAAQTLRNLRFILENEPELADCNKRWIVNRIADPDVEQAIIELLDAHRQPFIHIPFEIEAYRNSDCELNGFPNLAFLLNPLYEGMSEADKARAQAFSRRKKTLYAMNINGARNVALHDGRHRAKWVLPWDGACFVTEVAWNSLIEDVKKSPHFKYFVVPTFRTSENQDLLDDRYRPEASEEPQIIFRQDAGEEFDEAFSYGRRSKVELLWRLGIPGDWDTWRDDVWDLPRPAKSVDAGAFGAAGWVAKLNSGPPDLAEQTYDTLVLRGQARIDGIINFIDELDQRALSDSLNPKKLTCFDAAAIASLSKAPAGTSKSLIYNRLLQEADLAMQRGPYTVVEKLSVPPSGDKHDYFHPSPYWQRENATSGNQNGSFRGGERAPGNYLYGADSELYDGTRLQRFFEDTTALVLAGTASGRLEYHQYAATLVRTWFVDADTKMSPHLEFAQVIPGKTGHAGEPGGLVEMKDFYFFLDAVRLLESRGVWTDEDEAAFKTWLQEYLDWLLQSPQGLAACASSNYHGTCYDLQVASVAAYLGNVGILSQTFRRSRERLVSQFDGNGAQKHELAGKQSQHGCTFNLQSWVHLATLARCCGDQLWEATDSSGRGLKAAVSWMLSRMALSKWPDSQQSYFDNDRYVPLIYAAQAKFAPQLISGEAYAFCRKPIFFGLDGIMPFWMLSQSVTVPGQAQDDDLTKLINSVEKAVRHSAKEGTGKAFTAKMLERRLWGGYSDRATLELEDKKSSGASSGERALAAWSLGRWYSVSGKLEVALQNIREAETLLASEKPTYAIAELDCLIQLGRINEARDRAFNLLRSSPDDANLFFKIANTFDEADSEGTPSDGEERLKWFNKVFLINGLVELHKKEPTAALSIFNLVGDDAPSVSPDAMAHSQVSVVVPVHNGAWSIANALSGIQCQTWSNLQIIVVDDCSTDGTRDVVSAIAEKDQRIKLLTLKENSGAYVARNFGMRHARGNYVTVHDSDDWSHPQKIEMQMKRLRSSPSAKGVLSRWIRVRDDLFSVGYWRPAEDLISVNQSSFLFPRDLLDEIGMWDDVRAGADNEFIWRFKVKYGEYSIVETKCDLPLSLGLVREDSLTRQSETHVKTVFHGLRKDYQRSYWRWHKRLAPEDLKMVVEEGSERPFPSPRPFLPKNADLAKLQKVFFADFSKKAPRVDVAIQLILQAVNEPEAVIGIFHWPDYETSFNSEFHPEICDLLDSGRVEQISAYQQARADELVLCDPYLARCPIEGVPDLQASSVDVICEAAGKPSVVFNPRRRRMPTIDELEQIFSAPCKWVPIEVFATG